MAPLHILCKVLLLHRLEPVGSFSFWHQLPSLIPEVLMVSGSRKAPFLFFSANMWIYVCVCGGDVFVSYNLSGV